jgi:hypothetical protein
MIGLTRMELMASLTEERVLISSRMLDDEYAVASGGMAKPNPWHEYLQSRL